MRASSFHGTRPYSGRPKDGPSQTTDPIPRSPDTVGTPLGPRGYND